MNSQQLAFGLVKDEAGFLKPVHEKANARTGRHASGIVRRSEFGYGFSEIVLRPNLKIASCKEREHALDLLKKAERLCLVSRAMDLPLRFEPEIEVTEPQLSV